MAERAEVFSRPGLPGQDGGGGLSGAFRRLPSRVGRPAPWRGTGYPSPSVGLRAEPPDGGAGYVPARAVSGARESGHGRGGADTRWASAAVFPRRSSRSTRPGTNSAPGPRGWQNAHSGALLCAGLPAVTVSSAVSPKLGQLTSGASHPRGAPLADLHAGRRAFAGRCAFARGVAGNTAPCLRLDWGERPVAGDSSQVRHIA